MYMNYINNISANLNLILYADDTTITSPLCSFTHCSNDDISLDTALINLELCKTSYWLVVNELSLNVPKIKLMVFHDCQRVISAYVIPNWIICEIKNARVSRFYGNRNKRIHFLECAYTENTLSINIVPFVLIHSATFLSTRNLYNCISFSYMEFEEFNILLLWSI